MGESAGVPWRHTGPTALGSGEPPGPGERGPPPPAVAMATAAGGDSPGDSALAGVVCAFVPTLGTRTKGKNKGAMAPLPDDACGRALAERLTRHGGRIAKAPPDPAAVSHVVVLDDADAEMTARALGLPRKTPSWGEFRTVVSENWLKTCLRAGTRVEEAAFAVAPPGAPPEAPVAGSDGTRQPEPDAATPEAKPHSTVPRPGWSGRMEAARREAARAAETPTSPALEQFKEACESLDRQQGLYVAYDRAQAAAAVAHLRSFWEQTGVGVADRFEGDDEDERGARRRASDDTSPQSSDDDETPTLASSGAGGSSAACLSARANPNKLVVEQLHRLVSLQHADLRGSDRGGFRAKALHRAIGILSRPPYGLDARVAQRQISSAEELLSVRHGGQHTYGIGVETANKVREILRSGTLRRADVFEGLDDSSQRAAVRARAISELTGVWGVGPSIAERYFQQGVHTTDALATALPFKQRTAQQKLGLRHRVDLAGPGKRVPRALAEKLRRAASLALREGFPAGSGAKVLLVGSMRRGKPTSGDVDLLVCVEPARGRNAKDVNARSLRAALLTVLRGLHSMGYIRTMGEALAADPDAPSDAQAIGGFGYEGIGKGERAEAAAAPLDGDSEDEDARHDASIDPSSVVEEGAGAGKTKRLFEYDGHDRVQLEDPVTWMGVAREAGTTGPFFRLDVKVYPRRILGPALLYFTGSARFNRALRYWARRTPEARLVRAARQLSPNGPGVLRRKLEFTVTGATRVRHELELSAMREEANAFRISDVECVPVCLVKRMDRAVVDPSLEGRKWSAYEIWQCARTYAWYAEKDVFEALGLPFIPPWMRNM